MWKKVLAILLIICFAFVLIGCNSEPAIESETDAIETTEEVTADLTGLTEDLEEVNEDLGG